MFLALLAYFFLFLGSNLVNYPAPIGRGIGLVLRGNPRGIKPIHAALRE